jgi:predicted exporter
MPTLSSFCLQQNLDGSFEVSIIFLLPWLCRKLHEMNVRIACKLWRILSLQRIYKLFWGSHSLSNQKMCKSARAETKTVLIRYDDALQHNMCVYI